MTDGTPTTLTDRIEAALRDVRDPNADLSVFDEGSSRTSSSRRRGDNRSRPDRAGRATSTQVVQAMLHAVDDVDGVDSVHVERTTPTGEGNAGVESFDRVVAVASAKGGVGKSTVATHLACALAADNDVALFDADIHGPNVPELLDVSGPIHSCEEGDPLPAVRAEHRRDERRIDGDGAPLAWRGAMAHDALNDLFENTAWRNDDVLVLDLPPGHG